MKKKHILIIILVFLFFINCFNNNTGDKEYYARIPNYRILVNNIEHLQDINLYDIAGTVPFGTDRSSLIALFDKNEGATVTVNGVEQVSGETANDFTNTVEYKVVSKDGKIENTFTVDVTNAQNTEAKLISMTIAGYNCNIDQDNKAITLNIPGGTSLTSAFVQYQISENAVFYYGSGYISNNVNSNFSFEDNITIYAENQTDSTVYTFDIIEY